MNMNMNKSTLNFTYENYQFEKTNFHTGTCGRFRIFLNKEKTMIYKNSYLDKFKREMENEKLFLKYKNIIENIESKELLGDHVINGKIVRKNCADYILRYIEGFRLDHLYRVKDKKMLDKIKIQIDILVEKMKICHEKNNICGDWGIQNLIYSIEDDKIYNIDTEGFYTYPIRMPSFCTLDVTINKMYESLYQNELMECFTAIIWNISLPNRDKILDMIPNKVNYNTFSIKKYDLEKTINDIYCLDKRLNGNPDKENVLKRKVNLLNNCPNEEHVIVKFRLDNPNIVNNLSKKADSLKKEIRKQFCSKSVPARSVIHVSDNFEESNYLWKNYSPSHTFDIYIKSKNKKKIISLTPFDDEENTIINVISVFKGNVKHTNSLIQYFCYKRNEDDYYFSQDNNLCDNLCFSFYCTKHMISRFRF